MDFLDFDGQDLYFDQLMSDEVEMLLRQAALHYGKMEAELSLLKAYFLSPENLTVHVALYRYYFYQHRLTDAIRVAAKTLRTASVALDLPEDWRAIDKDNLGIGAMKSMGMVRYYFLALKAAGYLNIRVGNEAEGIAMLQKVAALDTADRLGAAAVLEVVIGKQYDIAGSDHISH